MRQVNRSALVPYSAEQMYELVDDIASYPEFLPWCTDATVHSRDPEVVEASLTMRRGGINKSFRTRNTLQRFDAIDIALVGGPFKYLSGGWQFEQFGSDGSKVSLQLAFEFDNRLVDNLFGSYFESISRALVDSFEERARKIHG